MILVDGDSQPQALSDACLRAATGKSRSGSDKGACQILTGGPAVPSCPETDNKVRQLFHIEAPGE